jgi:hypothetical protein
MLGFIRPPATRAKKESAKSDGASVVYIPGPERWRCARIQCCYHNDRILEGWFRLFGLVNVYHCGVYAVIREHEDGRVRYATPKTAQELLSINRPLVLRCTRFVRPVRVRDILTLEGRYSSLGSGMPHDAEERQRYDLAYQDFTRSFRLLPRDVCAPRGGDPSSASVTTNISFEDVCAKHMKGVHYIRVPEAEYADATTDRDDFVLVVVLFTTDGRINWSCLRDTRIADQVFTHFLRGDAEIPGVRMLQ